MKISVRNGFAPESSLDRVDKIVYYVSLLLKTGKVVAWNETPANLDGLTFRLEAGSRTSSYRLYAQNDGLWLENCATVIFFR